jgi:MFS family permease
LFELNRNLRVLFVVNIAFSLCQGLVSPLFSLFLDGLGANVAEIGLVLFIGGFASTIVMVPSGLLSDRIRRRNILISSSIMFGLGALYLTTVKSWQESVLGIILLSSAFSVFLPARHTMIADNTGSRSMAATYGLMNIAWPIGTTIGPILGGFLADNYGWNYAFYTAALVSFLSISPTYFFKRTYRGDKKRDKEKSPSVFLRKDFVVLLIVFSLSQMLLSAANGILDPVVPLYITRKFNATTTTVGFFLSMGFGVATLIAQLPGGTLAERYDRKKILAYSIMPLPLVMVLWPSIPSYHLLIISYMFAQGFWSMTWPVAQAYLMGLTPPLERGTVISIRQAAVRLGFTIGPLLGGYSWHAYNPTTPFYLSAILFTLSFFLVLLLEKT